MSVNLSELFPPSGGSSGGGDVDCNIPILDSPPANPELGEQWFSSTDGYLYIWYGAEWVAIGGSGGGSGGDGGSGGGSGGALWSNTVLQISADDVPDGSANAEFFDLSSHNRNITAYDLETYFQGSVSPYKLPAHQFTSLMASGAAVGDPAGEVIESDNDADIDSGQVDVVPSTFVPRFFNDGGSVYFTGHKNAENSNKIDLGAAVIPASGSWTMECWVKCNPSPTANNMSICTQYTNSQSGRLTIVVRNSSHGTHPNRFYIGHTTLDLPGNTVVADGKWHHLVAERDGNTYRIYVDGKLDGTATDSTDIYTGRPTRVGHMFNSSNQHSPFTGYIADFMISSVAKYGGSNFTVPTQPYTSGPNTLVLLGFRNAGIYDSAVTSNAQTMGNAKVSTSTVKYGTGSVGLDGSSGLLVPNGDSLNFGTEDFAMEAWVYLTAHNASGSAVISAHDGLDGNAYRFEVLPNGFLQVSGSGGQSLTSTSGIALNNWSHIAVSRESGVVRLFQGGIKVGESIMAGDFSVTDAGVGIGYQPAGPESKNLTGYIDDLRVTKGEARYTGNFTPPEKLTAGGTP